MEWWAKRRKHSFCHISSLSGNTVSLLCLPCHRLVKRPDCLIFQSPLFSRDGFNPLMFHSKPSSPSLPCVFRHVFSFLSQPILRFANFPTLNIYFFCIHLFWTCKFFGVFFPLFEVTTLSSPRLQRRHQGPTSCLKRAFGMQTPNTYVLLFLSSALCIWNAIAALDTLEFFEVVQ